jgi:hypothetical protein
MRIDQTSQLLSTAALVDNRKTDPMVVAVWHEILGDTDYEDAMAVLREHYRASEEYLMPVHIVKGVKALRRARLAAYGMIDPAPDFDIDTQDYAAHLRDRRELIASGAMVRDPRTGRDILVNAPQRRQVGA